MNIVAHNVASKLFVGFVAVAMFFMLVAPAKAATAEELQAQINALLAQVAALQGQVGQGGASSASAACPFTWTRSLNVGATGADVMKLQQFLNADAETRVAASGVGSAGSETEYFGPATAAAVSKFQVKYRSEVLSPAGLVNPTGYFGPATMAKANLLCKSAPVTGGDDTTAGDDTTDDSSDDTTSTDLSGEAALDDMTIDNGDEDTADEGAEDVAVADASFDFVDGDARISRMDVTFDGVADVWDVLDEVSLWVDGDEVAREDASDEDNFLDTTTHAGTMRFSGLNIIGQEDDTVTVTIAVSVQGNVDGADLGAYTVSVDNVRFFDADDVATTEDGVGDLGTTVSYDIQAEGTDDELIVKTSTEDPDGTTLTVKDDAKSDWYTVFAFDLDTDDSVNDIQLNEVPVSIVVSSSTFDGVVDDYELVIDGTTIDTLVDNNGVGAGKYTDGATAVLTFDVDGDVTIDKGDRVAAELKLRFKSLAAGNEGITVQGKVTGANADAIDAEGADDLDASQLSGASTGDVHTLRTRGVDVEPTSDTATVTVVDGDDNDYGVYTLKFDVTAFEQEVYIAVDPATSVDYDMTDSAGTPTVAGSQSVTLTSTADEDTGYFVVNEGETETFTLEVTYEPGAVGSTAARLQLNSLVFGETNAADDQSWTASPATDYRTDIKTIVN